MKKIGCLLFSLLTTHSSFADFGNCTIKLENHTGDPALVSFQPTNGYILVNNSTTTQQINMASDAYVPLKAITANHIASGSFTLSDRNYTNRSCRVVYLGYFMETPFSGGLQIDTQHCNIKYSKVYNEQICSGIVSIGSADQTN